MDPVVHFEMPYEDQKRVAAFYTAAFGWNMQGTSEEMGNYVLATTTDTGPQGRPKAPGAINGGFFPKKPDWPAQHPSVEPAPMEKPARAKPPAKRKAAAKKKVVAKKRRK